MSDARQSFCESRRTRRSSRRSRKRKSRSKRKPSSASPRRIIFQAGRPRNRRRAERRKPRIYTDRPQSAIQRQGDGRNHREILQSCADENVKCRSANCCRSGSRRAGAGRGLALIRETSAHVLWRYGAGSGPGRGDVAANRERIARGTIHDDPDNQTRSRGAHQGAP